MSTEQRWHDTGESELGLRVTLDGLSEGVILYDPDGRAAMFNTTAQRILGFDPGARTVDEIVRQRRVVDGDGVPFDAATDHHQVRWEGAELDLRLVGLVGDDGDVQWLMTSLRPIATDRDEPPYTVVSAFRDVTESLARERSLAEAEERFRSIFSMAPIGMGIVRNGYVMQANQAWADIVGRSPAQLEGRRVDDFTVPGDPATVEAAGSLGEGGRSSYRVEKRYLHAEGHAVWVQVDLSAVRHADGSIRYVIVQVQDIAERRRHQQQLEHIANHDALTGLLNRRGFQQALEDHVRHAGRYGADGAMLMLDLDHFILLPHGDREAAATLATALLSALREWRLTMDPEYGMAARGLSASIGIAMCLAGASADDLVVNADLAMYDAKEAGRDRRALYTIGDAGEQPRMKTRLSWLARVRWAIEQRAFELLAQPIVDLRGTSADLMYEVLLRLRSDTGELISPSAFLSVAERVDLIQDIDRLVIEQTLAALAGAHFPVTLSVNVSGKSIAEPELLATIDFGAGFGSFTYLKHFPFDFLKIDGEFVAGAMHSRADAVIVEAVRHIAHGLDRAVIAEQCSDASLVEFLRREGIDFAQGYHLGRPEPLDTVLRREPRVA